MHYMLLSNTNQQTTPHDGVTDDIIVPAGSGEGGIRCPEDDEDDCAREESSDNIISTTVKFTYKPTTKPPPKRLVIYQYMY